MAVARMAFAMRAPALTGTPAVPWTPSDLGAARKAHWLASDLANGAVTTWTDSVGGLAPTQASATLKPVKAAASFNSAYPGVTFDGVDDALVVASVGSLPIGTAESWMCILGSQAGSTGNRTAVTYGNNAASAARQINVAGGTSLPAVGNFTVSCGDATTFSGAGMLIGRWISGGASIEGFVNGRAFSTVSVAAATNTAGTRLTMGCAVGGSGNPWIGAICEVIITTAITTLQRQQIEGYWAWMYGLTSLLPAGHPYKNAAPTV